MSEATEQDFEKITKAIFAEAQRDIDERHKLGLKVRTSDIYEAVEDAAYHLCSVNGAKHD